MQNFKGKYRLHKPDDALGDPSEVHFFSVQFLSECADSTELIAGRLVS